MRAFFLLAGITIQQNIQHRAGFFFNLLTPILTLISQFLLWGAIYGGTERVGSMDRAAMFSYQLMAFMINSFLTWSGENELSREIRSGTIVARRMRPVPFLSQSLASMTGNFLLQGAVNVALVGATFVVFQRHLALPEWANMPAFVLSLLLGVLLRMMMVSFFSLLCFFTTGHLGLTWTRRALMEFFSGALIPVALFPGWLSVVSYCTPFPLMLQVPIAVCLGQVLPVPLWGAFGLQGLWVLIFYAAHEALYGHIRKTATLAGG